MPDLARRALVGGETISTTTSMSLPEVAVPLATEPNTLRFFAPYLRRTLLICVRLDS